MRTESLRLGLISVSLILALVFSMVFIAQPVLAPLVIYEPGGTTIEVEGGQEFTLRFRLRWDIEGELGYFSLAVYWDCPEDDPSENFTLENAAAYFDLDNDNLPDPGEDPIDLIVDNYEKPWGTGTRYSIVVHHDAGDSRDGEFNVDLKMRASGAGGVPHAPTNKHWIVISGTIDVPEGPIWYPYSPPNPFITIRVLGRGVGVEISEPRYQSGAPGTTLNYSVMVTNTGDIEDNYELTVSDNSGWELTLSDNLVDNRLENVQPGENENRIVTLSVTIPEDVENCAEDNITVTATGTGVENSDSCVAHALVLRGVEVAILPSYQSGSPGSMLGYIITVSNAGNVEDIYDLSVSDNEGWGDNIWLDNVTLAVPASDNRTTTLHVQIPGDAIPCTEDKITVTATSQADPTVSAENSCIAHAKVVVNVEVSILPESTGGPPGGTLTYEVTVTNKGNIVDTFDLKVSDMADPSWNPTLSDNLVNNSLEDVRPDESRIVALSVTVHPDASIDEEDTIEVSATSRTDKTVGDSDDCTAKATEFRRVEVSISPDNQSGEPEENLPYTVMVKNLGNISDDYSLEVSDNENWYLTLSDNLLNNVGPGENGIVTLTVIIPEDVENGAEDNITVIATSTENEEVSDSASCTATAIVARGVEVSILPENQEGPPGETLNYEVTVTNKGNIADNYTLTVSDNEGWVPRLLDNLLEVPPDENRTTTLRVTIFTGAAHSTKDNVTVTATSQRDNTMRDNASCIAHAIIVRGVGVSVDSIHKSDEPGETLSYTVTVTNTGNVTDSYDLTLSDSAAPSWNPTVSPTSLTIAAEESDTATLSVTIPSTAVHGEKDNIRVVATSREDAGVSASASCEAEVSILFGVEISVSPSSGSGQPGTSLTYTVTVRNAGLTDDTYTLRAVGAEGWSISIDPTSLSIAAGASDNATLTIIIPKGAENGTSMTTTVSAKSGEDPAMIKTDSCRTVVTGVAEEPGVELPVPLAISVALIGAAIIVPAYLLRERRKKAARRRVLRDIGFGAYRVK